MATNNHREDSVIYQPQTGETTIHRMDSGQLRAKAEAILAREHQQKLGDTVRKLLAQEEAAIAAEARRQEIAALSDALVADLDSAALDKARAQMSKGIEAFLRESSAYDDKLVVAHSRIAALTEEERKTHRLAHDGTGVQVGDKQFSKARPHKELHDAIQGPHRLYYSRYPMVIDTPQD